jgi:peptidoglycan/xylan/chitin deacetylase (PgdA/CDA1 family)
VSRQVGPRHVTIDLDGAWCYRRIHGHAPNRSPDAVDDDDDDPLLTRALPEILRTCARHHTRATLFVVGRDARKPRTAALLKSALAEGHDLQAHSFAHDYAMSTWPIERAYADVVAAFDAIEDLGAARPEGFRAPGYNLSSSLVAALVEARAQWSSSLLPSPLYFAARAAVIAKTRLRGRHSASLLGRLSAFAPTLRRSPARHFHRGVPLREYPISTAGGLPFVGTTLALLPDRAAEAFTRLALSLTPANDLVFELHAADFVDPTLLPDEQPDAGVAREDKLRRIGRALAHLAALGDPHPLTPPPSPEPRRR